MPIKKPNKKPKERGALKRAIRKVKAAQTITAVEATTEQDLASLVPYADLPMTAEKAKHSLTEVFNFISEQLAVDAPPESKANAWAVIKTLSQNAEKLKAYGRDAIIQLLKEKGHTEAGHYSLDSGGWHLHMRPHRTGLDPKKVEKALREKGMSPESWMTPKVTYSIKPDVDYIEALGADTAADCYYEESWTVAEPEQVENPEVLNAG